MLTFRFNFPKVFQASAVVLREHGGQMDCVRLLKLLYVADRELLAETGRTLTGDMAVALERGPVLHTVYSLIKERGPDEQQAQWNDAIRRLKHEDRDRDDDVVLTKTVPTGRLTKAEEQKLHELCERFRMNDTPSLSKLTHDFGEWAEAFEQDAANTINWEVALQTMGLGELVQEVHDAQKEQEQAELASALRG